MELLGFRAHNALYPFAVDHYGSTALGTLIFFRGLGVNDFNIVIHRDRFFKVNGFSTMAQIRAAIQPSTVQPKRILMKKIIPWCSVLRVAEMIIGSK